MDALRKIRDTVSKQQQAVFKTLGGSQAPQHSETIIFDSAELQRHQQLEKLYSTTKSGKHYQREIIKGVEGLILTGSKQREIALKLGEECKKYGTEPPGVGGMLGQASVHFSNACGSLEKERDTFHRALSTQIAEPLRAMVTGAPLDDARGLTQRYDKLRQEAEGQVAEVNRRQQKVRDNAANAPENAARLAAAESKLNELNQQMAVLGKEAASAMIAVEAQQQRLTLQRLIAMVEAGRTFHQRAAEILDQLQAQMVSERQRNESVPLGGSHEPPPPGYDDVKVNGTRLPAMKSNYFLAEVMHPFEGEQEGELTLVPGDFIVVRQVASSGWSEGEVKGKAGWFPSAYVAKRQRVPASKVVDDSIAFE